MAVLPASRAAFSMFTSQEKKNISIQISDAGLLGNCGAESSIQLFRERLSGKMCTRQPRKVIWDMINTLFRTTVAVEPIFFAFY